MDENAGWQEMNRVFQDLCALGRSMFRGADKADKGLVFNSAHDFEESYRIYQVVLEMVFAFHKRFGGEIKYGLPAYLWATRYCMEDVCPV